MSTIEERIRAINLHGEQKGDELSTQKYEQEMKFPKKEPNNIIGKQDANDPYNEEKSNAPQDHTPSYYGGMRWNI